MTSISRQTILIISLIAVFSLEIFAQNDKLFLGIKLRPEVRAIAEEVEEKTKKKIYAVFTEFDDEYTLGASFINDDGTAYLRVNPNLKPQKQKLEAVIAHELLHLRLRANNYPVFLFAPEVKTRRGLAQDVEQPNANDLASLIEHRIFKAEMDKFGLNQIVNLAGDTERSAERRNGETDGQSDAINFARAVLEYQNRADIENLRKVYIKNKWQKSLRIGQEIADLISRSAINSPDASAKIFGLCIAKLYPSARPFKIKPDKTVKAYRQMLIGF
jgi:predicted SprT family Zn-dependent metalloprotease